MYTASKLTNPASSTHGIVNPSTTTTQQSGTSSNYRKFQHRRIHTQVDQPSHMHLQSGQHPYNNIYSNAQSGGKYGAYLLQGSTQPSNPGVISSIYKKDYSKNKLDNNNNTSTSYNNNNNNNSSSGVQHPNRSNNNININSNNNNNNSNNTGASTGLGSREPASKLLMGNPSSHLFGQNYTQKDKDSKDREGSAR